MDMRMVEALENRVQVSVLTRMKECGKCKLTKPYTEFNKNKARKDGYSGECRVCYKAYKDAHYQANKAEIIKKVVARRQELIDKIWAVKCGSKCTDCGERNPIVLQFDHLGDKKYNVSHMPYIGASWNRIWEEIQKCDIVCANCHSIRTHERAGRVRNIVVHADIA